MLLIFNQINKMKKQFVVLGALACLFTKVNSHAQETEKSEELDEVVITATKFKIKKENTAKVIQKITQEDIKNNPGKTVLDLLNNVVGVEIRGANANATEIRSTYIRGGRGRQVLVLIDGVPVSDPTGINQEYDLRLLSLDQIESIEILKGASSTLYGSGAATGVINITLKKSSKNEIAGSFETSFGTNNDANTTNDLFSELQQNVNVNGTVGKLNFLTSFGLRSVEGLSAAKNETNTAFESDDYYSKNGVLKLGYNFSDSFTTEAFLNYDEFDYDFDAGAFADDAINVGTTEQLRVGVKPSYKYNSGEVYLLASYNESNRNIDIFSSFSNTTNNSEYKGKSYNLDLVNRYKINNLFQVITGLNYQEHSNNTVTAFSNISEDIANFNTIDPYASVVYTSDYGLNVNVGGRLNIHSEYGSNFVYDVNTSYNILRDEDLSLKALASYSSAFIAPSTFQLFSIYGNIDLDPETSKTIEAGLELNFDKKYTFEAVYFDRTQDDAIMFQSITTAPFGVYQNSIESVEVNGVEVSLDAKPIDMLRINLGYTYTDKNMDIDYIPTHKFVGNLEVKPLKNTFVSVVYRNVGERPASFFNSTTFTTESVTLDSYSLVDFNANYTFFKDKVTVFGSVTNLLNEDYDDILGYTTRGRNFRVGLRLQL